MQLDKDSQEQPTIKKFDFSKPKKKEESEGLWLLSFSDMMLVLLSFFILMLSMMKPDVKKYENITEGMQAKKAVTKEANLEKTFEKINQVLSKSEISKAATVTFDATGLHKEFKDGLLFQAGSANSNPKFKNVTTEVMKAIANVKAQYEVKIEGHTDDVPVKPGSKFPSNWELSAARGFTLMRNFQELGLPEDRISVISYAHTKPKINYKPLKGKELEAARAANRRVVIWIE